MFKAGDGVVCIDNTDNEDILTIGKTYIVEDANNHLGVCKLKELPSYDWFVRRFELEAESMIIDYLVEIRQSEYDSLIEEINLLQELLAESNQKLAAQKFVEPTVFKPVSEYTMEDWEQVRDEKWVFELNNGTEVFVKGIMDEFDDKDHPIELSLVSNNLHECTVTDMGYFWSHCPNHQRSIKRRIK